MHQGGNAIDASAARCFCINFLEAIGDRRWGSDDGYKMYKSKTPILFPRLF